MFEYTSGYVDKWGNFSLFLSPFLSLSLITGWMGGGEDTNQKIKRIKGISPFLIMAVIFDALVSQVPDEVSAWLLFLV